MKPLAYLPVLILAIGCAVCGVFAWNEYNDLVRLRAAAIATDTEGALRKDVWRAQKEITDLKKRLAALSGAPASAAVASGAPDAPAAEQRIDPRKQFLELMKNPEFRKLQLVQMQGFLDQYLAGLYRQLNLPPEQLAQLRALALERVASQQDAAAMAMDQGIDPTADPKGFRAAVKSATDAVDTKIKALIGDAGFAQATSYAQTQGQRSVATDLQQSLSYTAAPLTDAQATQVAQILASNPVKTDPSASIVAVGAMGQPITLKGVAAADVGPLGNAQPVAGISDAAINQASGILSQQQVAALKQLQQVQQSQHDLAGLLPGASGGK